MLEWAQVLNAAGKAFSLFKNWSDTLTDEREIFIPEGMLNTGLTAITGDDSLQSLLIQCHDDWLEVDALARHDGIDLQIRVSFRLQSLTINRHQQVLVFREREAAQISIRQFPSALAKAWLLLQIWGCRHFLRKDPLQYAVNKMEGFEVRDGVYRLDLSPFVRQKSALVAALYALDIRDARVREGGIYIIGSANVKSVETLRGLYQMAAGALTQVAREVTGKQPVHVNRRSSDDALPGPRDLRL